MLAICWASALATIYLIDQSGLWQSVSGVKIDGPGAAYGLDGTVSAGAMLLLVSIIFPLIMVVFYIKQRKSHS